ncbi:MAG TPA: CRTAC1 family protein, partial [Pirellulales bacterium]|nr:CRTAC1 family protein [Pirellulales bacterium]
NIDGRNFEDVTEQAGLHPDNNGQWGSSAGFMDLDRDGDLDLVILNYLVFGPHSKQYCELTNGVISGCPPQLYEPQIGELWRNGGDGRFELVPANLSGMAGTGGAGMVLAFADYDDDGRTDFYIGNDGKPAELMHNVGQLRFENLGMLSGLSVARSARPMAAMGADWGDFNRDGLFDLTVTDFQSNCFALYRNEGDGFFLEVSNPTGISSATCARLGFGAKWLDMDNDRWPDICFVNGHVYDNVGQMDFTGAEFRQPIMLFHNLNGTRFVDLVPAMDAEIRRPLLARGSATGDFNRDGRTDLLIVDYEGPVVLLENRTKTDAHWLTLELRGASPNRFAYGATATACCGGETWIGQVSPTSSYLSSSEPAIHWGLGEFDGLDTLTVRWPSGNKESFQNIAADQFLTVAEGEPLPAGAYRQAPADAGNR